MREKRMIPWIRRLISQNRNHGEEQTHIAPTNTVLMMMTIMKLILLLLLATSSGSQAFAVLPQTPLTSLSKMALTSVEQADLVKKWSALEARAEELKTNPSNVRSSSMLWGVLSLSRTVKRTTTECVSVLSFSTHLLTLQELEYNIVKEMLELALEAVERAETDDFNHAMEAHKQWEKAEEIERALEKAAHEVHVEAVDADGILDAYKNFQFKEDREMRREMAVSDIAHRVESYVESRLAEVRAVELAAKREEDAAEMHLAELFVNEDEIRATLAELKALQQSKTMPKA
jgi:hypothetical protein